MAKTTERRIADMRKAIKAFDSLTHGEDKWFVASILLRHNLDAFSDALLMTPEVVSDEYGRLTLKRRKDNG